MSRPLSSLPLLSRTISGLTRAGYDSVLDVRAAGSFTIAEDLQVSHDTALEILREISSSVPLTRTLAQMLAAPSIRTGLAPIDRLLGVQPATQDEDFALDSVQLLNICGPPGSGKERVALCVMRMMLNVPEAEVLVIDCQGHLGPSVIDVHFRDERDADRVHVVSTPTPLKLQLFVVGLPIYLEAHPNIRLVVFASMFGPPTLRPQARQSISRTIRGLAGQRLVSIVITSMMQTHFPDGGTFSTSRAPAILRPQLRDWLPPCAHEIILVPDGRTTGYGVMRTAPRGSAAEEWLGRKEMYALDTEGWIVDRQ